MTRERAPIPWPLVIPGLAIFLLGIGCIALTLAFDAAWRRLERRS